MRRLSDGTLQDSRAEALVLCGGIQRLHRMTHQDTAHRIAGTLLLVAAPTGLISFFLLPAAFGWDFDLLFEPYRSIAHAGADLGLYRWGWLLDIPGYYLLTLPAMLLLRGWMDRSSDLAKDAAAFCGLGYLLIGASGAAMLAASTGLFLRYAEGGEAVRVAVAELHALLFQLVADGLWNTLAMLLFAIWALITGMAIAHRSRGMGYGLVLMGGFSTIDVAGGLFRMEAMAMAGLYGYLFGFPVWCAVTGILLRRSSDLTIQ